MSSVTLIDFPSACLRALARASCSIRNRWSDATAGIC